MFKLIVTFSILFWISNLSAQVFSQNVIQGSALEKNVLFVEAGGNGILLSLNYERMFFDGLGLRVGIGTLFIYGLTLPAMFNYYIGSSRQLELGIGVVYTDYFPKEGGLIYNGEFLVGATIGHKYQKENSNIILRFSFTPFYNPIEDKVFFFGGISLGCAF